MILPRAGDGVSRARSAALALRSAPSIPVVVGCAPPRRNYARVLFEDAGTTLDDKREAVTTLEELERIARRVFGGAHPHTRRLEHDLQEARAALRARETPSPGSA